MMSSPTGRRRKCGEGEDQQAAVGAQLQSVHHAVSDTLGEIEADPSAADVQPPQQQPAGLQPLPEQFTNRPRFGCSLHSLATVELQLCLQLLDTKDKLIAARCSRRLLSATSAPFAWRAAAAVTVTVRSDADAQRIQTSLLRFASVHVRCARMESLQCVADVPRLIGLELLGSPGGRATEADLLQLLQLPYLARLQTLQLDLFLSELLTVDTMRLIARLPQLRSFAMTVPYAVSGTHLQALASAPALIDLSLDFQCTGPDAVLLSAIGGIATLDRLKLQRLCFPRGGFLALCSSANMGRLRHLELADCDVTSERADDAEPPGANAYQAFFSALEQLQSLTLDVCGINRLLPRLHGSPALRLLSIRCRPDDVGSSAEDSLPSCGALRALLTAAPQLSVRLLMPAALDRWLALGQRIGVDCAVLEQKWHELQRLAAGSDRVTIIDEEPP